MTVLKVLYEPDSILRTKTHKITSVDEGLKIFIKDMYETMYATQGIGLSANQVGDLRRICVVDVEWGSNSKPNPITMINPEITWRSDEKVMMQEGCLSVPECYFDVPRHTEVKVKFRDENWKEHEMKADGLFAECIQHEVDHLDGILFIDYLSPLKRRLALSKLKKARRAEEKKEN